MNKEKLKMNDNILKAYMYFFLYLFGFLFLFSYISLLVNHQFGFVVIHITILFTLPPEIFFFNI